MKRKSAMYGVAFLCVANLVLQGLGILYKSMLSKTIGTQGMGVLSLLMPVYAFMMACLLPGLSVTVSDMTTGAWTLKKTGEVRQIVCQSRQLFFIGYAILFVLLYPSAEWVAARVLGDIALGRALRLLVVCFLFAGAESTGRAALMATGQIEKPFLAELTEQTVRLGAVCLFLKGKTEPHEQIEAVVYGMITSEIFGSIVLHYLFKKAFGAKRPDKKHAFYREIVHTAIPVNLSGIGTSFVQTWLSSWLPTGLVLFGLQRTDALKNIGAFTMASSFTMLPSVFVVAVGSVLMPRLRSAATKKNCDEIRHILLRTWGAVGCFCAVVLPVYLCFGKKLCFWIYKDASVAAFVPICACLSSLCFITGILRSAQNGLGLQIKSAVSDLTATLLCLCVDLWLVPRIGFSGYIVGRLTGELYELAGSVARIRRCTGISVKSFCRYCKKRGRKERFFCKNERYFSKDALT